MGNSKQAKPSPVDTIGNTSVLVTGGAGFIGSHLTQRLVELGCRVRVIDNLSTGFRHNLEHIDGAFEFVEGDVADADTVDSVVHGMDYVFHHAAMASVPRSMREPALCHDWCATSTVNILQSAARHNARRVILASTSAAYGNSPFTAKRETDSPAPLSPYAAAKLASEMYCEAFARSTDLQTVCLRYFNVFGPRQDPKSEYSAVIPRFVAMILAGDRPVIYGDGEQSRDFIYVGDIVQANLLAATHDHAVGQTFNVGRGSSTTLLGLLQMLRELLQRQIEPIHESPRPGDVRDSLADISKIRRELGFEPQFSIRAGLEASIEFYQSLVQAEAGT